MTNFREILTENILPFWATKMVDLENGGFYGRIDGKDMLHTHANKGAVLNARILWTFSAAYRSLNIPEYKQLAVRAFEYIKQYFVDTTYGGIYWELDYQGNPVNRKKQVYAQSFALYAFSEFYRATGNKEALMLAKDFFFLIERTSDEILGGYFEAFTEDWQPIDDMRLSTKDANEKKTMNTHLHVLEAYTNLYRIWDSPQLKKAQCKLINIFTTYILNQKTSHLNLFFDEKWNVKSTIVSYGHDIEAAWLLLEAAEVLDDQGLLETVSTISLKIATAASEGLQPDGSLIYEKDGTHIDYDRHWWVQAEAVVGFTYAYKYSSKTKYKDMASNVWTYIQHQLIDSNQGEWHWSRKADGSINRLEDKAGFWKCPYHNSRCCFEMIVINTKHNSTL